MSSEFWFALIVAVCALYWWVRETLKRLDVEMALLESETRRLWVEGQLVLTRTAIYRLGGEYPYPSTHSDPYLYLSTGR